jgi:hypothetical protein
MRIDGHYDAEADIAWVRFENYDPSSAVAEETDAGLRELDPSTEARIIVAGKDSNTVPVGTLGSIRRASGLEHLR